MSRVYVASSWRNERQPSVVKALRHFGHEVYDFRNPEPNNTGFQWSDIDPAWQSWTNEQYVAALNHPIAEKGFALDLGAMQWADTGVLLLPSGRSAHIEAGYFVGAGKPLHILLAPDAMEPCDGPTIRIPLTQGYEAIVDERDGVLAEHKWHVHPSKNTFYAARSVGPKGKQRTVFLHRVIAQAPDGVEVDHEDGNGLNCRRSNLRVATRAQNGQNIHTVAGRISFRGVFEDKGQPGRYRAAIRHLGERTYLGSYSTPEEAARAYDAGAIRLHGEFASTNFPQPRRRESFNPELMYLMATSISRTIAELVTWLNPKAVVIMTEARRSE